MHPSKRSGTVQVQGKRVVAPVKACLLSGQGAAELTTVCVGIVAYVASSKGLAVLPQPPRRAPRLMVVVAFSSAPATSPYRSCDLLIDGMHRSGALERT